MISHASCRPSRPGRLTHDGRFGNGVSRSDSNLVSLTNILMSQRLLADPLGVGQRATSTRITPLTERHTDPSPVFGSTHNWAGPLTGTQSVGAQSLSAVSRCPGIDCPGSSDRRCESLLARRGSLHSALPQTSWIFECLAPTARICFGAHFTAREGRQALLAKQNVNP